MMEIRHSNESDKINIEKIHRAAFGEKEGPVIADLVNGLFADETATPLLSLVAVDNERIVGHILFTRAIIAQSQRQVSARILAPLAVLPDVHKSGIGTSLIDEGLKQLKQSGVELVFVLGHPDYYPRCGFTPAGSQGFEAPYPIPEKDAAAWMVQEISGKVIGEITGTVKCSRVLDQPEHWRE